MNEGKWEAPGIDDWKNLFYMKYSVARCFLTLNDFQFDTLECVSICKHVFLCVVSVDTKIFCYREKHLRRQLRGRSSVKVC